MKSVINNEPLPFSDYAIIYFVDLFGVSWLNFYYLILLSLVAITIGGWVTAFYIRTKCLQAIHEAREEEKER